MSILKKKDYIKINRKCWKVNDGKNKSSQQWRQI